MFKKNHSEIQQPHTKKPVLFICVCTIPTLLLSIIFMVMPTIRAFILSFTDATAMSLDSKFVGLDNYTYMFADASFIQALQNTLKLMLVVPVVTLALSLIFAF